MRTEYERYWDLSEKERASLTEDQFNRLLAVEVMEQGAAQPAPLSLLPEPQAHPLPTTTWYQVGPVNFESMEDARAFLELDPHTDDYDYKVGYDTKYPVPVAKTVTTVELHDKDEVSASAHGLAALKDIKDHNEKELARFNKESKAYADVVQGMWDDFHRQRNESARLAQILVTYGEYVKTSNGDHAVASKFIVKAYPTCDVQKAFEWAGEEWANDPAVPGCEVAS